MEAVKVVVTHDVGGEPCTKVWRFFPRQLSEYKVATVTKDLQALYPDIAKRIVGTKLTYMDSIAGIIAIEIDADLQVSATVCSAS